MFLDKLLSELRTTPLQVVFGGISATVSTLALYIAWRTGGSSFAAPTSNIQSSGVIARYLTSFSALVALSTTAALVARLTRRSSWISTYFGSIIYASSADFLITLVFRTQGVRFGSLTDQPSDTLWLIYAALVIIFAAFNGERLWQDVLTYELTTAAQADEKKVMVGHVVFSVGIVAVSWLEIVHLGSNALTLGLLYN